MEPLFNIPENLADMDADALRAFIAEGRELAARIGAAAREGDLSEFLVEGRTFEALRGEMEAGVAALEEADALLAALEPEPEATAELEVSEEDAAALAELADAAAEPTDPEAEVVADEPEAEAAAEPEALAVEPETAPEVAPETAPEPEAAAAVVPEPETAPTATATVTASAPVRRSLPRPARARAAAPPVETARVALTAASENLGYGIGEELPDLGSLASMMIRRRNSFGTIPEGTRGDRIPIGRAEWSEEYPEERRLHPSALDLNMERIDAVVAAAGIEREFAARRSGEGALTASGGLCAPVTPYYALQMLAIADRPVRGALPAFNADRGGINHARPASLGAITDAVGIISNAEDTLGGSFSTKTCQRIDCPPFNEVDVAAIYHCLEFGNIGGRTYPELVEQWTSLVLAALARTADSELLTRIDDESTAVTADSLGLGASAAILSQALAAANGMRNRHRMRPETVLRALFPSWLPDLFVSDVYRTQFERFDMTRERFVGLLRQANIEPTFYLDGADGAGQVFGSQSAGALASFPADMRWYLYPEGSFLYLDAGVLELGLVRDSVLNATNDWQIFGEFWENVAFIGVESLAVTTPLCDSGVTVAPATGPECPIDYSGE